VPVQAPATSRSLRFAERLASDEELVAEICKRFETARSEGRFSILSALLTETSEEDLEQFFRSGWAQMALPPRESSVRQPCDESPWEGDLQAYREDLYAGMAFGMPDMRAFAREWLEELLRVGYYGMEESLGVPLKQQSAEFFSPPRSRPLHGQTYPARVGGDRTDRLAQARWSAFAGARLPGDLRLRGASAHGCGHTCRPDRSGRKTDRFGCFA